MVYTIKGVLGIHNSQVLLEHYCNWFTLQYMGDQQGGAIVITSEAAIRQILFYLQSK